MSWRYPLLLLGSGPTCALCLGLPLSSMLVSEDSAWGLLRGWTLPGALRGRNCGTTWRFQVFWRTPRPIHTWGLTLWRNPSRHVLPLRTSTLTTEGHKCAERHGTGCADGTTSGEAKRHKRGKLYKGEQVLKPYPTKRSLPKLSDGGNRITYEVAELIAPQRHWRVVCNDPISDKSLKFWPPRHFQNPKGITTADNQRKQGENRTTQVLHSLESAN